MQDDRCPQTRMPAERDLIAAAAELADLEERFKAVCRVTLRLLRQPNDVGARMDAFRLVRDLDPWEVTP